MKLSPIKANLPPLPNRWDKVSTLDNSRPNSKCFLSVVGEGSSLLRLCQHFERCFKNVSGDNVPRLMGAGKHFVNGSGNANNEIYEKVSAVGSSTGVGTSIVRQFMVVRITKGLWKMTTCKDSDNGDSRRIIKMKNVVEDEKH